jgi:hypothetical protein
VTNWVTITTNTYGLPRILPHLLPQVSPGSSLGINQYYYAYKRGVTGSNPVAPTSKNNSPAPTETPCRAIGVPVSMALLVLAMPAGRAGQVGARWCWVTRGVPGRLRTCLPDDLSPAPRAPAWPPSLA